MQRVWVIGCGHVGLASAACLAKLGHQVLGVDVVPAHIAMLFDGVIPFDEPGLAELVADGLKTGNLRFTCGYDSIPEIARAPDLVLICVNTPGGAGGAPDTRQLRQAVEDLARCRDAGEPLLVNRTTAPVGARDRIAAWYRAASSPVRAPRISVCPEFLRQGSAVKDFLNPQRIVLGVDDPADGATLRRLFSQIDAPIVQCDCRTAEMSKYVANAFLATRVSFANEMARVCDAMGIDFGRVVQTVGWDPRIGFDYLQPGLGFGGSCLPKDTASLVYQAESLGVPARLVRAVREVNETQLTWMLDRLTRAIGDLQGRTVAVWGITFKGDTEDTRDSPAVELIDLLISAGAVVRVYEPSNSRMAATAVQERGLRWCDDALSAAQNADVLAVLADRASFRDVALPAVRAVMCGNLLLDARNVLEPESARSAGFLYLGVGRDRASAD